MRLKNYQTTRYIAIFFLLTFSGCLFISTAYSQDEIRQQLDKAREVYDQEMGKYQRDVDRWFEKEDSSVRNAKSDIAKRVAAVSRERDEYQSFGTLPKRAPSELRTRAERIQDAFVRAFKKASDDYSRRKMDAEALAVDQEREQFESTRVLMSFRTDPLIGTTWDMSSEFEGEEKYLHRIELLKDGVIRGSNHRNESFWEVQDGKLLFRDDKRRVTTIFDQLTHKGSKTTITGEFKPRAGCIHVLVRVPKHEDNKAK